MPKRVSNNIANVLHILNCNNKTYNILLNFCVFLFCFVYLIEFCVFNCQTLQQKDEMIIMMLQIILTLAFVGLCNYYIYYISIAYTYGSREISAYISMMQSHKYEESSYIVFVDRVSVLKEKLPKAFEEHISINVGIAPSPPQLAEPPPPFNSLPTLIRGSNSG